MIKLETIQGINEQNAKDVIDKIKDVKKVIKYGKTKTLTVDEVLDQYDPNRHEIHDPVKHPDKIYTDADGNTQTSKVVRTSAPFQRLIVSRAAAFLAGNPINLLSEPETAEEKEFVKILKRIWNDTKLDYLNKEIARILMSETEVAELWFTVADSNPLTYAGLKFNSQWKLRTKIIAKSLGDDLYPMFDNTGDMIAFARGYSEKVEGENSEVFEIYTDQLITKIVTKDGQTSFSQVKNVIGKIPVIYYSQAAPEWLDVQSNITRFEDLISGLGDTNEYFSSPTTIVKGEIVGMSKKGEKGKLLEVEKDADVSLMTWNNAPEAIKLELETNKQTSFEGTQTPDISFESMKGLGQFSGVALKMLFLDAHLKANDKAPSYVQSLQRRVNYLKTAITVFDVKYEAYNSFPIKPDVTPFLPDNILEKIEMLVQARTGKIISEETAIRNNPLIDDPEKEIELRKTEQESEFSANLEE